VQLIIAGKAHPDDQGGQALIHEWINFIRRAEAQPHVIHFGEVKVETLGEQHVFEVHVCLGDLDPKAVRVQLYANGAMGSTPVLEEMKRVRQLADTSGGYVYSTTVSSARPAGDYTARVIPYYEGVAVPLEESRNLWQR
jgi:starch phosphorylase